MTQWTGEAWTELKQNGHQFLMRMFDYKTGCLITVDGSGDDKISPQGLENYQIWRLETHSNYVQNAVSCVVFIACITVEDHLSNCRGTVGH